MRRFGTVSQNRSAFGRFRRDDRRRIRHRRLIIGQNILFAVCVRHLIAVHAGVEIQSEETFDLRFRHRMHVESLIGNTVTDLIDKMDDIKDDLAGYGIEFEYKFKDFHDRCIKTDTGWTIQLGRGLDIYEKYSTYSIANSRQDKRKCKEFMVTYMKTKNA